MRNPWLIGVFTYICPAVAGASTGWFAELTEVAGFGPPGVPAGYERMKMPDVMASGAALFDLEGDGDLDAYLVNQTWQFGDPPPAEGSGRLYRHDAGGRFTDVTKSSGLVNPGYGIGVAIGDFDNDGDPDVFLANYEGDRLFRNRGDGTFEDVTTAAGISIETWSCSAAFFDYDLDGFLDLFVTQYVDFDETRECTDSSGRPDFCGPKDFVPLPDVLLRNQGDGTFTNVTQTAGIDVVAGAGLGVVCEDFDDNGMPDVYVANDGYPNQLWMNQGDGTFLDDSLIMGAAFNEQGVAEAGMGVVAADFDNDLDFDLFMTHLRNETHTLYDNLGGDLGFEDATAAIGLSASSMAVTGFGTVGLDVEHDGDLDLFVANGAVLRSETPLVSNLPEPWNQYAEPNHLFLNDGQGGITLLGEDCGTLCSRVEITRGVATGDLDDDGDLDLLLTNCYGPARLYRNDAPAKGNWLIVRAVDPRLQRDAIGARITVTYGDWSRVRTITRAVGYQSSSDPRAHFGLGETPRIDSITVRWPDGLRERFPAGATDRHVELVRGQGETLP